KERKDCAICRMEDLHQILKENLEDDPQSPNHEVLEALYEMRTKIALKYPVTRENDDDDLMSFIGPIAELMRQLNISLYTLNLRVSFHRLTLLAERHSLDVSQLFSTEELDEDFANRFVRSQYAHARKLTLSTKSKLEAGLEIPSSIELEQVQQEKMQFMNFIDQAQLEIHWIVFSIDKIDSRKEITKEERQKRAKLQRIQDEIAKLEQSVQTLQAQLVEPKSIGEVLALLEKRDKFQRAANELIRKRVACFGTTTCVLHPQATAILKRWEVK
ncbi:hypothetical protein K0U07_04220, partial [bacterium]|nr:hypothetical protein [bacterium]